MTQTSSILLLDNYDSFTYNLYHYLYSASGVKPVVMRNDLKDPQVVLEFSRVVLSPGPGLPSEANALMQVIEAAWGKLPILGVCLGHQAIAEFTGATLKQLDQVYHGVSRATKILQHNTLFKGFDAMLDAGSYHSWTVNRGSLPEQWSILAEDLHGELMAIEHKLFQIHGIQFHPESVLTPKGYQIIENWLQS